MFIHKICANKLMNLPINYFQYIILIYILHKFKDKDI